MIDEVAAAAGRDPADVITFFNFGGALTPGDLRETRDAAGRWAGGSPR